MLTIDNLSTGQHYILTTGPKRVVKVLDTNPIHVLTPTNDGAPEYKRHNAATVLAVSPSYPIKGHITQDQADLNEEYRRKGKEFTGDDLWREVWVDHTREKPPVDDPKKNPKGWERCLLVHDVIGRHGSNEGEGKGGSVKGQLVDAILIPDSDIHYRMFDPIDLDEQTRLEKAKEAERQCIIADYVRQKEAEEREKRRGNAAECTQWGPVSRLRVQMKACDLDPPPKGADNFNVKARAMLQTYLLTIGIDPWDVMGMEEADFTLAVEAARGSII